MLKSYHLTLKDALASLADLPSPKLNGCLFISQSFGFIHVGDGLGLGCMQHRQDSAMLGQQSSLFAKKVVVKSL